MAVDKSYARLGLFLVVTLAVVLATTLFFIQQLRSRAVIEMVTYTTDNVSGLDVSNPVRFRGVSVGRVTDVRVDPHGGAIEIDFEIFLDRLQTIGANVTRIQRLRDFSRNYPNMRAQIVANPVTGEAYLLLDAPKDPPPPVALGFTPTRTYVPAMASMFSKVQDRLPAVLERAEATLQALKEIVSRVPDSLDRSDRFFTNIERIFTASQLPALSADTRTFLTATTAQMAKTNAQIEQMTADVNRLAGSEGTLVKVLAEWHAAISASDLPATTRSARDASEHTSLAAEDLRRSLPAIRDSLEQLRHLARLLEEQPESMVYGPRPAKKKTR